MNHLRRENLYNLAGIRRFFFIDSKHLLKDLRNRAGLQSSVLVVSEIPKAPDTFWYEGLVSKNSVNARERKRNNRAGEIYEQTVSGRISRNNPVLQSILNSLDGRKFGIITEDQNGFLRFYGGKSYGLEFSYNADSGTTPGEFSGVEFEFSGQSPTPAPFVHGNLYEYLSGAASPDFGDVSITQRVLSDGFTIRVLSL